MNRSPVAFLLIVIVLGLFVAIWWPIFKKTGNSGALSLLMLVPLLNLLVLLFLAYSDWPVLKEVRALRDRVP